MTSHAYRSSWPDRASAYNLGVSWAANDTGMVFAWIKHVPNQSLMFYVGILVMICLFTQKSNMMSLLKLMQ